MEILKQQVEPSILFDMHPLYKPLEHFLQSNFYGAKQCFIAGGAARHLFDSSFKFPDIDLYVMGSKIDRHQVAHELRNYVANQIRSNVSITYKRDVPTIILDNDDSAEIQVIAFKEVNSIEELFDSYDFTCCQFALFGNTLMYTPEAQEDTLNRELVWTKEAKFNEFGYNIETRFWRIQKYLQKGFKLGADQADVFFNMPWSREANEVREDRVRHQSSGSDSMPSPPRSRRGRWTSADNQPVSSSIGSVAGGFGGSGSRYDDLVDATTFAAQYNQTPPSFPSPQRPQDIEPTRMAANEVALRALEVCMGEDFTLADRQMILAGNNTHYHHEAYTDRTRIVYSAQNGQTYDINVIADDSLGHDEIEVEINNAPVTTSHATIAPPSASSSEMARAIDEMEARRRDDQTQVWDYARELIR